jgi:hypothetical protein
MLLGDKDEPSALALRSFGLMLAGFLGLVGAMAWWRWHAPVAGWLLGSLALVVAVAYYGLPPLRRPLLAAWRTLLLPVERTISFVVLAIVYFLVFTPVGLFLRLLGRDPLGRGFEPLAESYYLVRRRIESDPGRYFRQF